VREMGGKIDSLDVNVLEALGKYGPRNISEVARILDIPRGTMLARIKRMSSLFYLRMSANAYHTNLGLKKAVVFAKATPGREDLLFNCMKVNKFYIYLSRCYGKFEGCFGIYVIPKDHTAEFQQFMQEMKKLVASDIEVYWSTCFHTVNRTANWFDGLSKKWILQWDEWMGEIRAQAVDLPYTLVDPPDFPIKGDEIDLFIIKELEKDATISLADIARKLRTTLQRVHHHYQMHVLKEGLIEAFQIFIFPFDRATSDMFFFTFKFDNREKMAGFALSLLEKPFVTSLGKVLGKNAITVQICLPRTEFRTFVENLSKLIRSGFLQSYDYLIQDLSPGKWSRETVPYEFFKDGSWMYDHNKHVKDLQDLVNQVESTFR
jgi:DNA-binding Lrp family transcriptional regulator